MTPDAPHSPADRYSHAVAVLSNRTGAAKRRDGFAGFAAEGNQQGVVNNPVFAGKLIAQCHFRFIGAFRCDIPQTIGDPMNMRVHANAVLAVSQRDNQIGRLAADAFDA